MSHSVTLIIKPVSTACNLSCRYCYHSNQNPIGKMGIATLEKIIRESSQLRGANVHFIWHGGEPLFAGLDFYKEAVRLQRLHFDSPVSNSIQTNGTLVTADWADFFESQRFSIGVSIDGPKEIHDKYRIHRDGGGTFESALRAVQMLKTRRLRVGPVCVVTRDSVNQPERLLNFFVDHGLNGINFIPAADFHEGALTDYSVKPDEWANFLILLYDAWIAKNNPRIKIQVLQSLISQLLGGAPRFCWLQGDCSKFVSIDADGSTYICGRFMGVDAFKVGNLAHSNFIQILDGKAFQDVQKRVDRLPEECNTCEWKSICKGGCAYHRLTNAGTFYFCSSFKTALGHIKRHMSQYPELKTRLEK